VAAKSLEAKIIAARAKLAALRGDERADLPSGPERTAYNKELRRAAVVAKKLEAVFASPDYAPAEKRVSYAAGLKRWKALPEINLTGHQAIVEEITYRRKDGTRAESPLPPIAPKKAVRKGRRQNPGYEVTKEMQEKVTTERVAKKRVAKNIGHGRLALKVKLGPRSLAFLQGGVIRKVPGRHG